MSAVHEKKLLQSACHFFPQLANSKVLERHVGHRPGRVEGIRLEREEISPGRYVIHNYGHGGGGITQAPGCTQEVVELVEGV